MTSKRSAVQIRVAGEGDADALASLRRAWNEYAGDPGFERRLAAWFRDEGTRRTAWLVEADTGPVGMGTMLEYRRMPLPGDQAAAWGYIGNMFVLKTHRGQGVGGALLGAMLDEADRRGYVRVVLAPSRLSIAFYARAGFTEADGRRGDRLLVRTMKIGQDRRGGRASA